MKINHFNICPTCEHQNTCVLTNQKSQVWSCSEYDETINRQENNEVEPIKTEQKEQELVLA